MSTYERRRRQRRSPYRRRVLWALAFVLVFGLGIALGEALEDNPQPATTITQDRVITLPPPAETVTVTTP